MSNSNNIVTEQFRPCCVCNKSSGKKLGLLEFSLPNNNFNIVANIDVTACLKCGFIILNTPSSQKDYDNFYKNSFYSPEYLKRPLSENEEQYFNETVELVSRNFDNNNKSILDIGCGLGYQLDAFKIRGFNNLYGLDPSLECVEYVNRKNNIHCELGTLNSIVFPPEKMEIVILLHVLEHIVDVKKAINDLYQKMPNHGLVYVEVPDATMYNEISNRPISQFYFQHVIHFDSFHLKNVFESNGFIQLNAGKRLRQEKGITIPCIWAVFNKSPEKTKQFTPNFDLAEKIENWFNNTNLDPSGDIANLALSKKPVFVWGIGIHAWMMLKMSPLKDCNIKALVDSNSFLHGKLIDGKKIQPLDILEKADENSVIFITALVHKDDMMQYINGKLNFKGEIYFI